jgi:type IV pilus assembly protein PilX
MNISTSPNSPSRHSRQSGVSLIIVMIMVVIIGLTSAAAIRNATSGERLANNIRQQNLAEQYAEAALRYCESQVLLADASRVATLQDSNIITTAYGGNSVWGQTAAWTAAVAAGQPSSSRTTLLAAQIAKTNISSIIPTQLPQCIAEKQILSDGKTSIVLTARGFSPSYTFNAGTGATTSGSVVWLQSILIL